MRIVNDNLWERVQQRRQAGVDMRLDPRARKAPLPLSHLVRCALCGGAMTIQERRRYSCVRRRESGNCDMDRGIAASALEDRAMAGLLDWAGEQQDWPAVLARAAEDLALRRDRLEAEIEETRKRIDNILRMIERGGTAVSLHQRLVALEQQAARLEIERDGLVRPPAQAPENLAARLEDRLANLAKAIANTRAARARHDTLLRLSGLIERIEVAPGDKRRETVVTVEPRRDALIALALEIPAKRRRAAKTRTDTSNTAAAANGKSNGRAV